MNLATCFCDIRSSLIRIPILAVCPESIESHTGHLRYSAGSHKGPPVSFAAGRVMIQLVLIFPPAFC